MCFTSKMKRSNKTLLHIDNKDLNQLNDDPSSFVKLIKCNHHLSLHPFHLSNVGNSIKEILNTWTCKYNKTVGGIVLGYQNVKILECQAPINYDTCFIHVDIEVEFFVFIPALDQELRGVVNKNIPNHIGCLVHKIFNVSLPKPKDVENWIGTKAKVGQDIQFRIIFIDLHGRLPYIRGELISILSEDSGISTSEEIVQTPKRNKKTKFSNEDDQATETPVRGSKKRKLEDSVEDEESPVKKKHKLKSREETVDEETIVKKHKKHKKTKHSEIKQEVVPADEADTLVKHHKKHKKNKEEKVAPADEADTLVKHHKKNKQENIAILKEQYQEDINKLSELIKNDESTLVSSKKKKSKKSKNKAVELESLPDLDLATLFQEEPNTSIFSKKMIKMVMADEQDRGRKHMNHSTSHDIQWSNKEFELPPDSDLEEILKTADTTKKKSKKRNSSIGVSLAIEDSNTEKIPKSVEKSKNKGMKRRHSMCADLASPFDDDDFVTPIIKKAKRKSK